MESSSLLPLKHPTEFLVSVTPQSILFNAAQAPLRSKHKEHSTGQTQQGVGGPAPNTVSGLSLRQGFTTVIISAGQSHS